MPKRDSSLLIEDMLEAAQKILTYTQGQTFDDFKSDTKTIDAVARNFEVIGEAASRLPSDFKENLKDIPWTRISGLRNRIIHEYFGIDYEVVWNIRNNFLPELIEKLQNL
jgi:uncharacterized protein with HEPN domain